MFSLKLPGKWIENTNPDCLSDMVKDKIVAGSKEADDDNVRELWAKLMIAEIKQPGNVFKTDTVYSY